MVSITPPPTFTLKRLAISAPNTSTRSAGLRSVSGWNSNQFDPRFEALVSQKDPQLVERPTISSAPFFFLAWLLVQVLSDANQIFYSYCLFSANSRFDNAITDSVIQPSLKLPLLARQPFHEFSAPTARTPRTRDLRTEYLPANSLTFTSFFLEGLSQPGIMVAQFIYWVCIPVVSLTCVSNRYSPQINTQAVVTINRFWWLRFNLDLNIVSCYLSKLHKNLAEASAARRSTQKFK